MKKWESYISPLRYGLVRIQWNAFFFSEKKIDWADYWEAPKSGLKCFILVLREDSFVRIIVSFENPKVKEIGIVLHFRLDYQPLFGKWAHAAAPPSLLKRICLFWQIREEHPLLITKQTCIARKLGFPEVIMPGKYHVSDFLNLSVKWDYLSMSVKLWIKLEKIKKTCWELIRLLY